MDAKAPTTLGDVEKGLHEIGKLGGEGGELIDRDQEARQRLGMTGRPVGTEIGSADTAQLLLPVAQLCLETDERPPCQPLIEVGDQSNRMREVGTGVEGASSLVVHQDEHEMIRVDGSGQRHHDGAEQLALPRAGGPCHQPVRPIRHQVDDQRAVLGNPEGGGESWFAASSSPSGLR